MEFEFRKIAYEKEFREAILAIAEAFKDHWGFVKKREEDELAFWKHRLENDPDFDPGLWFLAMDGDQIAGVCLCFPKLIEDPQMGWVAELARSASVATKRNRSGIATTCILRVLQTWTTQSRVECRCRQLNKRYRALHKGRYAYRSPKCFLS